MAQSTLKFWSPKDIIIRVKKVIFAACIINGGLISSMYKILCTSIRKGQTTQSKDGQKSWNLIDKET